MKKGILFVLTAAFLASCQQEENEGVASVDRVTITPIITRATEVNFEDQDQIGLSITKEDGTVYATNELMTFNDGAFAGSLKWYPEGADKSSFVAYYPYSATGRQVFIRGLLSLQRNRCTDFIHRACRPDHQLRNLRLYGGKQIRRTSFGELHQHDLQAHADQTGY